MIMKELTEKMAAQFGIKATRASGDGPTRFIIEELETGQLYIIHARITLEAVCKYITEHVSVTK